MRGVALGANLFVVGVVAYVLLRKRQEARRV